MAVRIRDQDKKDIGEFVCDEWARRRDNPKRQDLVKSWDEVDRQIKLVAKRVKPDAGQGKTWMSEIELPLQAMSKEIGVADARRLIFPPRSEDWYLAYPEVTDEWSEMMKEMELVEGVPLGVANQQVASMVAHAMIDHFHRQWDYRAKSWSPMIAEGYKYGTFAGRAALLETSTIGLDYRGEFTTGKIPILVPVPMRSMYLDDAAQLSLHEGLALTPAPIREFWQHERDIKLAAKGGDGWDKEAVARLEAGKKRNSKTEKRDHIHLLEYAGEIFITRKTRDDTVLTNQIVTVAEDVEGGPTIVRWREETHPFRSYVVGHYERDDPSSPYGTSPMLKGVSLEKLASEAANNMVDGISLQLLPPTSWNPTDQHLLAAGGPDLSPNAKFKAGLADSINTHQIGNPEAALAILQSMLQLYAQLTGMNEFRRSGEPKSHTTAFQADVEQSRGILRAEDYVASIQSGPLMTWLYMLYDMGRDALGRGQSVFLNSNGEQGHINLSKKAIPKRCDFTVHGAAGVVSKRERFQLLKELFAIRAQIEPLRLQLPPDRLQQIDEFFMEVAKEAGIVEPERFIGGGEGQAEQAQGGPALPQLVGQVA